MCSLVQRQMVVCLVLLKAQQQKLSETQPFATQKQYYFQFVLQTVGLLILQLSFVCSSSLQLTFRKTQKPLLVCGVLAQLQHISYLQLLKRCLKHPCLQMGLIIHQPSLKGIQIYQFQDFVQLQQYQAQPFCMRLFRFSLLLKPSFHLICLSWLYGNHLHRSFNL